MKANNWTCSFLIIIVVFLSLSFISCEKTAEKYLRKLNTAVAVFNLYRVNDWFYDLYRDTGRLETKGPSFPSVPKATCVSAEKLANEWTEINLNSYGNNEPCFRFQYEIIKFDDTQICEKMIDIDSERFKYTPKPLRWGKGIKAVARGDQDGDGIQSLFERYCCLVDHNKKPGRKPHWLLSCGSTIKVREEE